MKQKFDYSEFKTPHFRSLQYLSPRIDCLNDKNEWVLAGTGILFAVSSSYYVITAAHCIKENPEEQNSTHFPEKRLRVVLHVSKDGQHCQDREFEVVKVKEYLQHDDDDFALLEIKIDNLKDIGFDYDNQIKLIGSDIDTNNTDVSILGHDEYHTKGRLLTGHCSGIARYHLNEHFTADGKEITQLEGFSGAGVFTKKDSIFYCMGYVKSICDSQHDLDEFEIRYIKNPELGDIWQNSFSPSDLFESSDFANNDHEDIDLKPHQSIVQIPAPAPDIETFPNFQQKKQDYENAWIKLRNYLYYNIDDEEEYSAILKDIIQFRSDTVTEKHVDLQCAVERMLFNRHWNYPGSKEPPKKEDWSENDKVAFSLVMLDRGSWPALYGSLHQSLDDLKSKPYMKIILHRAATLTGDETLEPNTPESDDDQGRFELIMRDAFDLDFKKMKDLVESWDASDKWLPKKIMLESLWYYKPDSETNGKEKENILGRDLRKLKTNIDAGIYSDEDKFIACITYNTCKGMDQSRLDFKEFKHLGLDSPTRIVEQISENIDKSKFEPVPYGIHRSSLHEEPDGKSFPDSLRIIQYLLNTGLLPNTKTGYIVNYGVWMKVFRHLFHNFPKAMVFYTLCYFNENLSILCAQEIAFDDDSEIGKIRNNLLVSILKAIQSDSTPSKFYRVLYRMAIELFPVVDEILWFEDFYRAVQETLSNIEINMLSSRDAITQFIGEGISNLNSYQFKKDFLSLILGFYELNPTIFSYVLSWSMHFDLTLMQMPDVEKSIVNIIENYPLSQSYGFLQKINFNKCLSDPLKAALEKKLKNEDFSFARDNQDALILLSYLVIDNNQIEQLKQLVLNSWDKNYWNCGISGNTFSFKGYLRLDQLDDRIEYTAKELEVIIANMRENIEIIKNASKSDLFSAHISSLTASLLLSMRAFLDKPNIKAQCDTENLQEEINRLIMDLSECDSIIGLIGTKNFHDVYNGIQLLQQLITEETLPKYIKELSMLIHMAMFQVGDTIEIVIDFIAHLVRQFPVKMITEFKPSLEQLIKNYFQFDYQELNVHAINVRENLKIITNQLRLFKV